MWLLLTLKSLHATQVVTLTQKDVYIIYVSSTMGTHVQAEVSHRERYMAFYTLCDSATHP